MPFIPPETIERARQMDLLTYLRTFEPNELVHIGGNHYCTREHDSLKISNGKWYWFSRGFGGYNALDYLVKVKDVPFVEAVERISGVTAYTPPTTARTEKAKPPKVLLLPKASRCASHAYNYLRSRGIDLHFMVDIVKYDRKGLDNDESTKCTKNTSSRMKGVATVMATPFLY